jgi:hypothetical protein
MLHSIRGRLGFAPDGHPSIRVLLDAERRAWRPAAAPDLEAALPAAAPHRSATAPADVERWAPPTPELLARVREGLCRLATGTLTDTDIFGDAEQQLPPLPGTRAPADAPGAEPYAPAHEPDWRVGWSGPAGLPLRARGARVIEQLAGAADDVMLTRIAAEMLLYGTHIDLLLTGMRAWEREHPWPEAVDQAADDEAAPVLASSAVAW